MKPIMTIILILLVATSVSTCSHSEPSSIPAPIAGAEKGVQQTSDTTKGRENPKARIVSEESARRLARAIYADIALYNEEEITGIQFERVSEVLRTVLSEGRELFQSRVSVELHRVFDEEFTFLLRAVIFLVRIDSPDAARFFARSLLEDAKQESKPSEVSSAVEKARQTFCGRVPKNLYPTFDATVTELGLDISTQ